MARLSWTNSCLVSAIVDGQGSHGKQLFTLLENDIAGTPRQGVSSRKGIYFAFLQNDVARRPAYIQSLAHGKRHCRIYLSDGAGSHGHSWVQFSAITGIS